MPCTACSCGSTTVMGHSLSLTDMHGQRMAGFGNNMCLAFASSAICTALYLSAEAGHVTSSPLYIFFKTSNNFQKYLYQCIGLEAPNTTPHKT